MTKKGSILVGTAGQGVMMSADDGESWMRGSLGQGLHSDCVVRALVTDPDDPHVVYAGTDRGLYRSDNGGRGWQLLDTPMKGSAVWSVAIDPVDRRVIFAGTGTSCRPGIYRSLDSGQSWQPLPVPIADECIAVGVPRPTAIAIDPTDHRSIWVGLEVDGMRHSSDGGDTWTAVPGPTPNLDVHNMLVTTEKVVFTLVNDDVWRSTDNGENWQQARARETFPGHYPRGIAVRPDDPHTVFVTIGDATPGRTGNVMRSRDAGMTWESLGFPVQPNSALWTVTIPPSDPDTMFTASRYGYLYRSDDGGDSWRKLWREFSEVSSVVWVPE